MTAIPSKRTRHIPAWLVGILAWLVLPALVLGGCLAALDGLGKWLEGWVAYSLLLGLVLAVLIGIGLSVQASAGMRKMAAAAFLIRLSLGVLLMILLPIAGYRDNPNSQAGYVYKDSFTRDQQAWELASSGNSLLGAFSGEYSGDQYGGMLALSAWVYRVLSPGAHRPFLILILTAGAAAAGALLLWKSVLHWFDRAGEAEASSPISTTPGTLAGWVAFLFSFYPESVLLGSSHMREAFVMLGVVMAFFSLEQMQIGKRTWLAWLIAAEALLFLFQTPIALVAAITVFGLWILEPGQRISWRNAILFGGIILVGLGLVVALWASLPSLAGVDHKTIILTWMQRNFGFQSYLTERSSGMVQKLLADAGRQWQLLIVMAYGIAQPVLPATLVDPAPWIWRMINILRAVGWYALSPFLIYGFFASLRSGDEPRRWQWTWLNLVVMAWILIAAVNAGGDQWDNPRYRVLLLAWQALLVLWAWWSARRRQDPWLWRWLAVEGIFVFCFTEWYLARYISILPHLGIWKTIAITLGLSVLVLAGSWLRDRRRTDRGKMPAGRA